MSNLRIPCCPADNSTDVRGNGLRGYVKCARSQLQGLLEGSWTRSCCTMRSLRQVFTSLPHFTGPVPGKQTWFSLSSIVPSFVGPLSHEILSGLWILYIYYFKYFTPPGVIWWSWTEFLISYGTRLSELKKKFSLNVFFLNSWTCSIVDRLKLNCLGYKHSWFTLTLAPRLGKASSGM